MPRPKNQDPSVAELLAWMRDIPTPSWAAVVRSVEYAVSEMKDEARLARRQRIREPADRPIEVD